MKYIFGLLIISFCSTIAYSQLEEKNVTAIGQFRAQLTQADKLDLRPKLPEIDSIKQNLRYRLIQKDVTIDFKAPTFSVLKVRKEPLPTVYKGYIELGYGTPNQTLGNIQYYTKLMDEKLDIGLKLNHHGLDNSKKVNLMETTQNGGALDATYYLQEGMTIDADLGFDQNKVNFYAIPLEGETQNVDNAEQRFNHYQGSLKFYNGELTGGDLSYYLGTAWNRVTDNFDSKENNFLFEGSLSKYFDNKHLLDVDASADFTNFEDSTTVNQKLNLYTVQPDFTFHANKFYVKGGVNIVFAEDETKIFPEVEILGNIIQEKLSLFAGWKGGVYKNNFMNLTQTNPFLVSNPTLSNSYYLDYYGGAKGNYKKIDYEFKVGFKNVDNLSLFTFDSQDSRRFATLTDTVNIFYLSTTVEIDLIKNLDVILTWNQNAFDSQNEEKAWHLPNTEANLSMNYKMLDDKLSINTDLYLGTGINYINRTNGEADRTGTLFDLSFGAQYWFLEKLGAFVQVNNIADNKFQRWAYYPTTGINIMGGIKARF